MKLKVEIMCKTPMFISKSINFISLDLVSLAQFVTLRHTGNTGSNVLIIHHQLRTD